MEDEKRIAEEQVAAAAAAAAQQLALEQEAHKNELLRKQQLQDTSTNVSNDNGDISAPLTIPTRDDSSDALLSQSSKESLTPLVPNVAIIPNDGATSISVSSVSTPTTPTPTVTPGGSLGGSGVASIRNKISFNPMMMMGGPPPSLRTRTSSNTSSSEEPADLRAGSTIEPTAPSSTSTDTSSSVSILGDMTIDNNLSGNGAMVHVKRIAFGKHQRRAPTTTIAFTPSPIIPLPQPCDGISVASAEVANVLSNVVG
jgi:hypothetical protein